MTAPSPEQLMARPLVIMALEMESDGLIETLGWPVVYAGVGKLNAAYGLMKALREHQPSLVINAGSAGSHTRLTGETLAAHRFVQRDMDATGLGFALGETPFDTLDMTITHAPIFSGLTRSDGKVLPDGICASGDSFLQGEPPLPCDLIDMEAYALARLCKLEDVPFGCLKYVTDGADHTAHEDWQVNVKRAAEALTDALQRWRDNA